MSDYGMFRLARYPFQDETDALVESRTFPDSTLRWLVRRAHPRWTVRFAAKLDDARMRNSLRSDRR